jgi:23S rRNA (guanosine2251-2'-O)-methyltransferase
MVMKGEKVVNAVSRHDHGRTNHWVYGYHAVLRRLEVNPGSVVEVVLAERRGQRTEAVRKLATAARVRVRETDGVVLQRQIGTTQHQGVAALAEPFRYGALEKIVASRKPVLVLDQIQDPHNFGALIRTAVAGGVAGIVVPRHRQAEVTPAVEKAAAGAVNDIVMCQAGNLCRALEKLRSLGFWVVGLAPREGQELFIAEIPTPVALVVGGESGLRRLVERTCDMRVSIPMSPGVESLNTSVAAAIAIYELRRRSGNREAPAGSCRR